MIADERDILARHLGDIAEEMASVDSIRGFVERIQSAQRVLGGARPTSGLRGILFE